MNDSLEAVKGNATSFDVYVYNSAGQPVSGKTVTLSAQLGKVTPETLTTDSSGRGRISGKTGDNICSFTSDGNAGWGEVKAEMDGKNGTKAILCHRVSVSDFSEPRLLLYSPDSDDADLVNPKIEFSIDDKPAVGAKFSITCTIYSLSGHSPIAQRAWAVTSAGSYTKNWSDFFFPENTPQEQWQGRSADPGEGIYPFDVTVSCTQMNTDALEAHGIKSRGVTGSDWKSSQTLTIKPHAQNAWSLSYDESSDTTKLAYIVDIQSSDGKEPQNVRIDVYDPDLKKVGEVTNQTIERSVSEDGKTFTYYFNGPVEMETAGDYHFVVEAQGAADDPDAEMENKDAGKWALEQNSSAKVPTFVTFGGKSPGIDDPGAEGGLEKIYGSTLDTTGVSIAAADRLSSGGYKILLPKPKPWWATDYRGVYADGFTTAQDIVSKSNSSKAATKPMQYNAVWLYAGHGGGGNLMAIWDPANVASTKNSYGWDNTNWTYISANGQFPSGTAADGRENISLPTLSWARRGSYVGGNFVNQGTGYVNQLYYARLVCFIGCDTANNTKTDLPSVAVQLGAKNAIGIIQLCVGDNAVNITRYFFDYLKPSKNDGARFNVHQAAYKASFDVFGDFNVIKVAGKVGSGIFGTDFGWGGDGLGPEGK